MPPVQTTPSKKIGDGRPHKPHNLYNADPPYFGDEERLKSGGATADRYQPVTPQSTVEGEARAVEMCEMPGIEMSGWPKEGNRRPRTPKLMKKSKGMRASIHEGGPVGRGPGGSY